MSVNTNLTTSIQAGRPYFRLTPQTYFTTSTAKNKQVVNGNGGMKSQKGSRYAFPATCTVYLTEDVTTCLAEAMFYFHREVLTSLDAHHVLGVFPSFQKTSVLWEITFKNDVVDVADLTVANASAFGVYPALMLNPSQDYHHLRQARGRMQALGYNGIIAPSTRVVPAGNRAVAFAGQSNNVASISPHPVDIRLVCDGQPPVKPFSNHAVHLLSYGSGQVRSQNAGLPGLPANSWQVVRFNH